jgi:anthranilate synthase/aminodeoxychorismate synthase-like glutamine amidotransferase
VSARILLIDNYDSFTFNLVQGLRALGAAVHVARNDELTPEEALLLLESRTAPTHLVLSPGPGTPARAGHMPALLELFQERIPILGVCLGHQAIGARFGGRIVRATRPQHGKVSRIYHDGRGVLRGLPNPFEAGRYHSLCVAEDGLGSELAVSAWTAEGEVMGLRHRRLSIEGVQFHPESILTPRGGRILANFLALTPAARLAKGAAR